MWSKEYYDAHVSLSIQSKAKPSVSSMSGEGEEANLVLLNIDPLLCGCHRVIYID